MKPLSKNIIRAAALVSALSLSFTLGCQSNENERSKLKSSHNQNQRQTIFTKIIPTVPTGLNLAEKSSSGSELIAIVTIPNNFDPKLGEEVDLEGLPQLAGVRAGPLTIDSRKKDRLTAESTNSNDSLTMIKNGDDRFYGSLLMGGKIFRIQPISHKPEQYQVIEITPATMDHSPEVEANLWKSAEPDAPELDGFEGIGFEPQEESGDDGSIIDVMVTYDPGVDAETGGVRSYAELAIEETNQSFRRSGIDLKVRLVALHEMNRPAGSDWYRFLDMVEGHDSYKYIRALRDKVRADVVVALVHPGSYCGVASAIGAKEHEAYAVASIDCAVGYYTFAHEIGHLVGARHIYRWDKATHPYRFGHGWCNPSDGTRSVMAYGCRAYGLQRIKLWSQPNHFGTADLEHNARVWSEAKKMVSNFRKSKTENNCSDDGSYLNVALTKLEISDKPSNTERTAKVTLKVSNSKPECARTGSAFFKIYSPKNQVSYINLVQKFNPETQPNISLDGVNSDLSFLKGGEIHIKYGVEELNDLGEIVETHLSTRTETISPVVFNDLGIEATFTPEVYTNLNSYHYLVKNSENRALNGQILEMTGPGKVEISIIKDYVGLSFDTPGNYIVKAKIEDDLGFAFQFEKEVEVKATLSLKRNLYYPAYVGQYYTYLIFENKADRPITARIKEVLEGDEKYVDEPTIYSSYGERVRFRFNHPGRYKLVIEIADDLGNTVEVTKSFNVKLNLVRVLRIKSRSNNAYRIEADIFNDALAHNLLNYEYRWSSPNCPRANPRLEKLNSPEIKIAKSKLCGTTELRLDFYIPETGLLVEGNQRNIRVRR